MSPLSRMHIEILPMRHLNSFRKNENLEFMDVSQFYLSFRTYKIIIHIKIFHNM